MKIKTCEKITVTYHLVGIEGRERIYERYASNCWREIIGESTETVFPLVEKELEAAFQEYADV